MITIRRSMRRPALALVALAIMVLYYMGIPRWGAPVVRLDGVDYKKPDFDWSAMSLQYPRTKLRQMPSGKPLKLPAVQHVFTAEELRDQVGLVESRKQAVLHAFRRSWASYKKYAWGWDELVPVAGKGRNTFGGYAATIIDTLGTLWIMGLTDEFEEAVGATALIDWNNTTQTSVNMFETTIRYLGGLLSAHDLSGEAVLLSKAKELGEMLYFGFDTPNGMPPFWLKFSAAKHGLQTASDHDASTSGGSLSLEFTRLSQLTGDPKWYDATERVKEFFRDCQSTTSLPGMWPAFINFRRLTATESRFTIGAQADSLYEYLPKMHALLGGLDPEYPQMTSAALDTISAHLLFRPMTPEGDDILFAGDVWARSAGDIDLTPDMQHLSCFLGGTYALASRLLSRPDYLETAARLTRGCVWAYKAFPTGLMPEISTLYPCADAAADGAKKADSSAKDRHAACEWSAKLFAERAHRSTGSNELPEGFVSMRDSSYLLRPEAIESVFYMWRVTGDVVWREAAWDMFTSIIAATETPLAYSAIRDVNTPVGVETQKKDSTESFWYAETLKYFYLIFDDPGIISLDEWVLNTEAHPFKRPAA